MKNTQHTPGPWSTDMDDDDFWRGCDDGDWHEGCVYVNYGTGKGSSICSFTVNEVNEDGSYYREGYWPDDEQRANARLIAAAPELYELALIIDNLLGTPKAKMMDALKEKARTALAKARGESQA